MEKWQVGIFTSIDAGLGLSLPVAREIGVRNVQLHAPERSNRTEQNAHQTLDQLGEFGIELTAVFGGFAGESYADIPTVARTVGLVPPETRAERLTEMQEISDYAQRLQCSVVALHLGFVPHDTLCDHCSTRGQTLHLETGQESAEGLLQFMSDVGRDNLFINFDPANMILYGTGEPIEALRKVSEFVRSVHCKDATWSDQPGETWGEEVPLGEGQVGMEAYLRTLEEIGYAGPLTIEREIPQEADRQKSDIGGAVKLLETLREKILLRS